MLRRRGHSRRSLCSITSSSGSRGGGPLLRSRRSGRRLEEGSVSGHHSGSPEPGGRSPVHMLNRFSTLRVSTLCMRPTSTVNTGVSNVAGIVLASPLDCTSKAGDGRHDCGQVARDWIAARQGRCWGLGWGLWLSVVLRAGCSRPRRGHSTNRGQRGAGRAASRAGVADTGERCFKAGRGG